MKRNHTEMNGSKVTGNVNTKSSNRLASLLDQLDKVLPTSKSRKFDEKDIEQIRYITNKIQQLMSSQEKCRKDIMTKQTNGIIKLLDILSLVSTCDLQATFNIVACFNELLTSGKRIGTLTDHDLPDVLFRTLISITSKDVSRESSLVEELITLLHSVLSKMGTKEKRFSVQARMTGALQVSLNIAKQNSQNFKILHPVLQLLKIYANSSVNCNIMVKGGAIETMLKIIPNCGQKRNSSAKLILEILALLVKSKIGARRAVIHGGVPLLMNMFIDWHRIDHRHRQTQLRKAILNVLKLIVMINSGRKAMINMDGTKILYSIGLEGLEAKELDGIVKLIILILRRSFAIPKLPVRTFGSIFSDQIKSNDGVNSEDETTESTTPEDDIFAENQTDETEVYIDEASENDDETDAGEKEIQANADIEQSSIKRQDIEQYKVFFQELSEFTVDFYELSLTSGDSSNEDQNEDELIRIPTATMENATNFNFSPDESTSNHNESMINPNHKHCFPLIKKSSSFDNSSLPSTNRHGIKLLTLTNEPENESEITTTSLICNSKTSSQKWYESPRRHKIPSMPCIPVVHANNIESVEFTVKGVKLHGSSTSSPSLKTTKKTSFIADDQIPELLLQEEAVTSQYDKTSGSGYFETISRLDRKQPYAASEIELNGVEHILPFVKKASPELHGHYPLIEPEPLLEKKPWLHRHMIFQDFARFLNPDKIINRVAYDLDDLVDDQSNQNDQRKKESIVSEFLLSPKKSKLLQNKSSDSLSSVSDETLKTPILHFESRFESGNLRKAIQIRQYEYDLILNPDINTDRHCQWFYFEVSNMEADVPYRFNIINCEKFNSQFNFGMQPVLYSTKDAINGRAGWERSGSNICYYKNYYQKRSSTVASNRYYYTTTFTIRFPYSNDSCYLAYHFPFTFTMIKNHLNKMESRMRNDIYYKRQLLCQTSLGNPCELLTITEKPKDDPASIIAFRKRPYVLLTSRVHPGESCASWVMKGVLDFLTSNDELAMKLREVYIFKIVPFLNPDGVINGNHRCSMSGEDLNRKWISPDPHNNATIYHTKGIIHYLNKINKTPLVYCDFHGHSRKKNVFMYGCSVSATNTSKIQGNSDAMIFDGEESFDASSSISDDITSNSDENTGFKTLPRILNAIAPAFSIQSCNYVMEKSKEATARIVVYKELGVVRSYTIESTYCGADQGPYKGNHFGTRELEEMGKNFAIGLLKLSLSYSVKLHREYFREPYENDDSESDNGLPSASNLISIEDTSQTPFISIDNSITSNTSTENIV